jgi:hypothetical protein
MHAYALTFPTFTIPTLKCCSLILTFDEIEAVLAGEPHIVQVGLGEIEKSKHLVELGVNWLFAPQGWPVMASGFNPAFPSAHQSFIFDTEKKCMQFSTSAARTSLTYPEMVSLAAKMKHPAVDIVCMPCEENFSENRSKKKQDRRNLSFLASIEAIKSAPKGIEFVVPLTGPGQQLELTKELSNIIGVSALSDENQVMNEGIRFFRISSQVTPEEMVQQVKHAVLSLNAQVVETDLPFLFAKRGLLLANASGELIDLREPKNFEINIPIVSELPTDAPDIVKEAAKYMRSYIHHLFRCEELAGPIILSSVNLFHFKLMFDSFRNTCGRDN